MQNLIRCTWTRQFPIFHRQNKILAQIHARFINSSTSSTIRIHYVVPASVKIPPHYPNNNQTVTAHKSTLNISCRTTPQPPWARFQGNPICIFIASNYRLLARPLCHPFLVIKCNQNSMNTLHAVFYAMLAHFLCNTIAKMNGCRNRRNLSNISSTCKDAVLACLGVCSFEAKL